MGMIQAATVSGLLSDVGTYAGILAVLGSAILAGLVLSQGRTIAELKSDVGAETERATAAEEALTAELMSAKRATAASQQVPQLKPVAPAVAAAVAPTPRTPKSVVSHAAMPALGSATAAPQIVSILLTNEPEPNPEPAPEIRPAPIVIPAPAATVAASRTDTASRLGEPSTVAAGGISRVPRPPEPAPVRKRRSPLPLVLVLLAVGGGVAYAVVSGGSGSGSGSTTATTGATGTPQPMAVVAVLNGTPVSGLAGQVSRELVKQGFKRGKVATASQQQTPLTTVSYLPGHLTDAEAVTQALGLKAAPLPADDSTQSIACPPPSACNVDVIVTVGSDRTS